MRDVKVSVGNTETQAMMEELSVSLDLPLESFSADLDITERAEVEQMKSDALDKRTLVHHSQMFC